MAKVIAGARKCRLLGFSSFGIARLLALLTLGVGGLLALWTLRVGGRTSAIPTSNVLSGTYPRSFFACPRGGARVRTGSGTGPPREKRAPRVGISSTVFGVRGVWALIPGVDPVSTPRSSKVDLSHAINLRALCDTNLVTLHPRIWGQRNPRTPPSGWGTSLTRKRPPHRSTIGP